MAYPPSLDGPGAGHPMQLYTTPLATTKFLKNPVDVFGHWAICIDGYFYEVTRVPKKERVKKGPRHKMRCLPQQEWEEIKREEKRVVKLVEGFNGRTSKPYTQDYVEAVATQVWEKSFEKKYAVEATNCQVFTRLLVDLLGDADTKAEFPSFFDQWVKRAGLALTTMTFVVVGTMATIAAVVTLGTSTVDSSGASAAAFAASANIALGSATSLRATRVRQEQRIQKAHAELRENLKQSNKTE